MELIAQHVTKTIKRNPILTDINLELYGGKVYGFTGRNGSGKTMLFRALSGLMRIDRGQVSYNGEILHEKFQVLPDLGITLENSGVYLEFSGRKNLQMLAGIHKKIGNTDIDEAIRRVGLDPEDNRPCRKYSLGMKQKIAIAQAIMEHPRILMLDEPTNSLDENGVQMLRKIIGEEREKGVMILLASHSKEDIQLLSDEIYCMVDGTCKKV